jgi:putative ABC transport system ATP-binding protein
MALLQALNREGITIVVVTHESDVAAFASRIISFRDGRVVRDATHVPNDAAAALEAMAEPTD